MCVRQFDKYRNVETNETVAALAALAQTTRLSIFRMLVPAGPKGISVGEIGASVDVAPATLSFHLKEMLQAGLIEARQEGRFIFYSADYTRMDALLAFLTDNCCAKDGIACLPNVKIECAPAPSAKPTHRTQPR